MFKYGDFFTYKDFLEGYHGQDYMGVGQFVFLIAVKIFYKMLNIGKNYAIMGLCSKST